MFLIVLFLDHLVAGLEARGRDLVHRHLLVVRLHKITPYTCIHIESHKTNHCDAVIKIIFVYLVS